MKCDSKMIGTGLAALLSAIACGPRHAVVHATLPSQSAPAPGIAVTGYGKAAGAPNIARTNVGVEARSLAADQAMRDANARMAQVIAALKQLGIAESDLRTQGLSLNFEREDPPRPPEVPPSPTPRPGREPAPPTPPAPSVPQGSYRATNTVEVTIRNLDQAGQVLGAASSAGANLMFGLEFDIEDRAPLEAQARQKAMADAKARAEGLAQLSGVKLGRVISISEAGSGQAPPSPMMMMRAEASNVPFQRGELTIMNSVTVLYELDRNDD